MRQWRIVKKLKDLWNNSIFSEPISLSKLLKRIDSLCERANKRTNKLVAKVNSEGLKTEGKIESEKIRPINNSRNLPSNVTIREEYVKCGKSDCLSGPTTMHIGKTIVASSRRSTSVNILLQ